jgi:hypothetical protein
MALQPVPEQFVPSLAKQWTALGLLTGASTMVLSATNTRQAYMFEAPKTGSIDRMGFGVGVFTTGGTVQAVLEGVTAGLPNGTPIPTGAAGTVVVSGTGGHEITFGTAYPVTARDLIAGILEWSGTAGNIQLALASAVAGWASSGVPWNARFSGSWTRGTVAGPYVAWLRYTDGSYHLGPGFIGQVAAWGSVSHGSLTTATAGPPWNGDEIGNEYVTAVRRRYNRVWMVRSASALAAEIAVYVNGTEVATVTLPATAGINTGNVLHAWTLPSPLTIDAGATVRVAHRPTTTSTAALRFCTWHTTALKQADGFPGTTRACYRSDAGSWGYDDTSIVGIGLVNDQEEDGVAAGGAAFPLIGPGGLIY